MILLSPPALAPVVDTSLAAQIEAERCHMMWSLATPALFIGTLFALLGAVAFQGHVDSMVLQTWVVLKLLTASARMLHVGWHQGQSPHDAQAWRRQSLILLVLDGGVWGAAGLLAWHANLSISLVLASCLMGIATLACFSLQASWRHTAAYCLPVVSPIALILLRQGAEWRYLTGLGMALFAVTLLLVSQQAQQHLMRLLRARLSTARLAREHEDALTVAHQESALKSRFVATMSHELRTPLHGILGLARMLRNDRMAPLDRQRLALVERSGEHLLSVINNILDLSRIEAGHLSLNPEPFDLHALLSDVAELTQVTALEKGLQLHRHLRLPQPCIVRGDPARVRQILLNLLGNAVKFTPQGQVQLSAWRETPDGVVVMQVQDAGIGIAPESLPWIFAPFHQIDGALDRRFGGTGLGLTISREIARAMQGDIDCESTLGEGTTFTLRLPLPADRTALHTRGARLDQEVISATTMGGGARPIPLRGHVLLAEDNEVNAMVVQALLDRHGLSVTLCETGLQVLACLRQPGQRRADLVLMDCHMPAMDGFEATRQIRQDELARGLPRLPVVALTAHALAEDSQRCLDAGMDAYLAKPFRDEQLLAMLRSWLPHGGPVPT